MLATKAFVLHFSGHKSRIRRKCVHVGFDASGGSRFPRFISGKAIANYLGPELKEKLEKPLIFQAPEAGPKSGVVDKVYGFDVTLLIDVCNAITNAETRRGIES